MAVLVHTEPKREAHVIIVGGTFEVDPDQREAFIAGRLEVMKRSRAEAGCEEYVFAADPVDPARVVLFERWTSQADLDAHLAGLRSSRSPSSSTEGVRPRSSSIVLYDVAGERRLS